MNNVVNHCGNYNQRFENCQSDDYFFRAYVFHKFIAPFLFSAANSPVRKQAAIWQFREKYPKFQPLRSETFHLNLDQKQPDFPEHILPDYLEEIGVPYRIVQEDTYSIVTRLVPEGKTFCSVCSRLRRGILYNVAIEENCTKIALGHHADDIINTFLLNLFFVGQLKAMPPILRSDDGRNTVIRPLAYCQEKDVAKFAEEKQFPIIPCNLCGSQPNLKRARVKQLINELAKEIPHVRSSIMTALTNVTGSHLLDAELYDFENFAPLVKELKPLHGSVEKELDAVFDHSEAEIVTNLLAKI